jgi:hypothetical protein
MGRCSWIPGLPLRGHPGMTMQKEIGELILTADSITLAFGGITR